MVSLSFKALKTCLIFLLFYVGLVSTKLSSNFYAKSCPNVLSIIKSAVNTAVSNESRMGASLLRLHFHDCFINASKYGGKQGCDASILLDDTANFTGEKTAVPNANSLRGFNVIDTIKSNVESACPGVVSCADILAVAARDSVVALGGPSWKVRLGRRDSTTASFGAANSTMPSPTSNLSGLISAFSNKGLTAKEMVALSGLLAIHHLKLLLRNGNYLSSMGGEGDAAVRQDAASPFDLLGNSNFDSFGLQNYHCPMFVNRNKAKLTIAINLPFSQMVTGSHTIGQARCTRFRARLYSEATIDSTFASNLKSNCPRSGGDNNLSPLDTQSPTKFNNDYYKNLLNQRGLLHSDQQLFSGGPTDSLVIAYSNNPSTFSVDFANAMIKMGKLSPLTGTTGQIRKNCRKTN
ncbi:hem peroxidase [Dillenia turbinata]|uniref:Peroxidase n=1 Tax=Dillenia turbinata TaxID=194707 RepID=A0AAN8ZQU3_9MAGN